MKKIILYCIVLVNTFQIACSQNKKPVTVEQVSSKYSTILYVNSKDNNIDGVRFYLTFDITNNTNEQVNISFPEYVYNRKYTIGSYLGWRRIIHTYFNQNGELVQIFGNKEIGGLEKLEKTPRQYIFTTYHAIRQDSTVQSMFTSYLEKMQVENKDTLHIGTISELKEKKSPIVQLLEGDSIILSFGRNDIYIDPIPVQIK